MTTEPRRQTTALTEVGGLPGVVSLVFGCGALTFGGVSILGAAIGTLWEITAPTVSWRAVAASAGSGVFSLLLSLFVATMFLWRLPRARREAFLREHGVRSRGRVQSMRQTALARYFEVEVVYETPTGGRVGRTIHYVARGTSRHVVVGAEVDLLVHPDDPSVVTIAV